MTHWNHSRSLLSQRQQQKLRTLHWGQPQVSTLTNTLLSKTEKLVHVLKTCVLILTTTAKPKQQKELNKKQQAIEAASLNRPDTSAATNMATGEKSRAKEGNSLDAYYAQMREVHGRNMRASEARREPTCWRNNRAADPEAINRLAESVMRDIAAEGDLVTTERVGDAVFTLTENFVLVLVLWLKTGLDLVPV